MIRQIFGWLLWQLFRIWMGCSELNCTFYWKRGEPNPISLGWWHERVHRSFLEEREWPHYGMVTEAGDRYARRLGIYQYATARER